MKRSFLVLPILFLNVSAEELAPDDPSISDNLGAWFTNAETTFDSETGIWADSSGNERDATPVGEINVTALRTYLAPTLASVTGSDLSANELSSIRFDGSIDDLMVSTDLNSDAGLTDLTIFVVMNVDLAGASASTTRPVGFGSLSAVQTGAANYFNLASDPSIRKDNGSLGTGQYTEDFPTGTFIRTARMSPTAIDEWFNTDGSLVKVLGLTEGSFTTSNDEFYLGDVRAGASTAGILGGLSPANIDIVQSIVYTAALSDQQVADINEWIINNLPIASGGGGGGLAITNIEVAADLLSVDLTWNSTLGVRYAVDISTDLNTWDELTDGVTAAGGETTFSTATFIGEEPPSPPSGKVFFRVRETP